ncbi:MAG: UbiD family decarboxylase [Thermoplasmatota archaeon]|nr:UbiD family decarboxylase [Candidatus Thermoplasmatota archaeon]MBU1915479.1 UbiD family decarboxylase [Candidatus Thermoplasmatota archaeon]
MAVRELLNQFNETVVVKGHVSRELELTNTLFKEKMKPVLFENLDGFRAVGNLWSTRERIARAMGVSPEELTRKMMQAMDSPSQPQEIDKAPFEKNILTDFDLRESAIPKFYPTDGGRFITAGVVVAEHDGIRNLSFHRLMMIGENKFAIRVVPRHLFALHKRAMAKGEDLKIAVAVGLCPSIMLSAAMNLEFGKDELTVANSLRQLCLNEPVCVRKTRSGLLVPAFAEYIFEGRMTKEVHDEGPFVDITGTVDPVRKQPVVEIDRIYHRDDPIFQIILPGVNEHYLMMGMPREPVIQRAVGLAVPEVHAVRLTEGGCCWLHGVVSITKQKEGDGVNAIMAAMGAHPSMKMVTIVDNDIDIFDDRDVEWAVATRFQGHKGLVMIENARGSSLDPSADETTTKVGIDATKPIGGEGFDRVKPV